MSRAILGETFSVTVPVRLESAESLADDCLAADVFFGDDKLPSSAIAATLLPGQGLERTVRISTTALINEPVVTLYVIAGCKAKVTRKFVAFADPPMVAAPALAQSGSTSAVKDMAPEASAVVASAVSSGSASASVERLPGKSGRMARDSRASKTSGAGLAGDEAGSSTVTASAAASRASEKQLSGKGGLTEPGASRKKPREQLSARLDPTPAAKEPASRLVLDPVEADAVVAPNLSMSGQMVSVPADLDSPEARDRRAAAAALWAAMSASPEQLARDRIRMQELEQRLAKLQQDAASAREKVVSMEARVREAEDARLSNPIVMGLAGVCVLLAGALGYLFWRQRQREADGAWWQPGAEGELPADDSEAHSLVERSLDRTSAEFVARPPAPAEVLPTPVLAEVPSPVAASALAMAGATSGRAEPPVISAPVVPAERPSLIKSEAQEAVREITVEELIDLEQQAEFFVVLGQDDAAVELLESHVQNTAGASPLPYLKLLEIYQRLGRKAQYQQVQADFNGRFNAYAPSWESDLLQGHALEEYPGVVERLQSLWSRPAEAMDVLQKSLTRPDESVETFDLPAYRELLFLYAVARDLSERESAERQPVDLMGQAAHQLIAGSEPMAEPHPSHEPLMATRPVKASPDVRPPSLSLDLSLDDPASGHGALVDEAPLHIDLPEIDGGVVDGVAPVADRTKGSAKGNGIEFEHIEIDAPHKG